METIQSSTIATELRRDLWHRLGEVRGTRALERAVFALAVDLVGPFERADLPDRCFERVDEHLQDVAQATAHRAVAALVEEMATWMAETAADADGCAVHDRLARARSAHAFASR